MLKVLLKFNDEVLETFQIDNPQTDVGRNAENDICIDNLAVSSRHARISNEQGQYLIEDLNSTNGTYVNEKRITKKTLKNNDTVTIGKHTLVICVEQQGVETPNLGIQEIDRTMELDTKRHKEMLKKEAKH